MPVERDGTVRVHRALTSPESRLIFGCDRNELLKAVVLSIAVIGTAALVFGFFGIVVGPIYFFWRLRRLRALGEAHPLYFPIYEATKDEQTTYGPRRAGARLMPRNRWRLPSTYLVRTLTWRDRLQAIFVGLEQDRPTPFERTRLDMPLFGIIPGPITLFFPGLPTGRELMLQIRERMPRIYRNWALDDPGEALEDRLPWRMKGNDPFTIVNRQATFTRTWAVYGPDFSGKSIHDMNRIIKNPFDALITNGTKPGFVIHFEYDQFPWDLPYPDKIFPSEAATLVNEERRLAHEQTKPFNGITKIHLTYIPHLARARDRDLDEQERRHEAKSVDLAAQLQRDHDRFTGYADQFETKLNGMFRSVTPLGPYTVTLPNGRSIEYDAQLETLWRALTGKRQHVLAVGSGVELYRMFGGKTTISNHKGTIRCGTTLTRVVQILDYPELTVPDMFAALEGAGNLAIRGRFIRDLPSKTAKDMERTHGEATQAAAGDPIKGSVSPEFAMQNAAAAEHAESATRAKAEHDKHEHAYGYTSIGIFLYEEIAPDEDFDDANARLLERASQVMGQLDTLGFRTEDRSGDELERLLACLGGNTVDDVVRPMLSSRVFVNLITTAHPWLGDFELAKDAYRMHNGRYAPALAMFPTNGNKPFGFSPIDSNGNGNTLFVGDTGAGKSGLVGYLTDQHTANSILCVRGARQIILDKDGSHILHARLIGGHVMSLSPATEYGFAPFYRIDERTEDYDGLLAAEAFLKLCIRGRGKDPNDYSEGIAEIIVWLKQQPPRDRTMSKVLRARIATDLRDILTYYSAEGAAGNLFEGAEPPQFTSDFIVLDQSFSANNPELQRVIFFCITEMIETMLRDSIPTVFVTEEAWDSLKDPIAGEQYENWIRRVRKFEFWLWLITHNIGDIDTLPNPDAFLQNFGCFVILPSKIYGTKAGKATLARINLDEQDAEQLKSQVLDEDRILDYIAYVVKDGRKRTINYRLGPVAVATVATTAPKARETYQDKFVERYGPDRAYREWIRARAGDAWTDYYDENVAPIFAAARAEMEANREPGYVA